MNDVSGIERTIQSVLSQDYPNIEYIVVDGGSTDGTLDIIRRYDARLAYWVSEKDSGIYAAMNKGIEHATGAWLSFINSSDFFYDQATLSVLCSFASKASEGIRLVYGDTLFYDKYQRKIVCMKTDRIKINMSRVNHQSCLMRNGPWMKYDTSLRLCADHNIIYPMVHEGRSIYVAKCVAIVKALGKSSNRIRTMREGLQVSFRYGGLTDRMLSIASYCYAGLKWIADITLRPVLGERVFQRFRHSKDTLGALL
jgi:glycosyltransferase involved in cell wall biosynthesis